MSARTDAQDRALALAIYKLRQSGHTNREIARIHLIDVKRVPTLAKLGATLATLEPPHDDR